MHLPVLGTNQQAFDSQYCIVLCLQEVERERREVEEIRMEKLRSAAKAEKAAAWLAAREERARNLKLMPQGAAIVEDQPKA